MVHLFHPALVHVSVAFLIVGGALEAWGVLTARVGAARFGGAATVVGTLSLVPTIATGYVAANAVYMGAAARRTLAWHELNGWLVLGVFVAALFWKAWCRGEIPPAQRPYYGVLLLLGVALAAVSAFLGGELVYVHGVGVAGVG